MADTKLDMTVIRHNLGQLRKDRRNSTPDNVFRISTVLPNGMTYADFALYYVLRNKKTGVAATGARKPARATKDLSSDSASPPLPQTRRPMDLGKKFREVIGDPQIASDISAFTVSKRRKRTSKK